MTPLEQLRKEIKDRMDDALLGAGLCDKNSKMYKSLKAQADEDKVILEMIDSLEVESKDGITKQSVLSKLVALKGHLDSGRTWEVSPLVEELIKTLSESISVTNPNEELRAESWPPIDHTPCESTTWKSEKKKAEYKEMEKAAIEHEGAWHWGFQQAFISGALWQKEQMLKNAIEGRVIAGKEGSQYIQTIVGDWKEMLPEKVKLIIIKDDEGN